MRRSALAGAVVALIALATHVSATAGTTSPPSWAVVPSDNGAGGHADELDGVSCPAPADCWAAGFYYVGTSLAGNPDQTLIEHNTGSGWGIVASPDINTGTTQFNELYGISCPSLSSCWAVGSYYAGGIYDTLIEHYDGSAWQVVSSPSPAGSAFTQLYGVSCSSTTDCWAVGSYAVGAIFQTLAQHWDGSSWTTVASPNASVGQNNELYAVSCAAAADCTAVGYSRNGSNVQTTLVEHWDGTAWTVVPSANAAGSNAQYLRSVDCRATGACVAVGAYYNGKVYQTLTEVRGGAGWAVDASPNTGATTTNELLGVSCDSTSDCWAVGAAGGTAGALTEHYAGGVWSLAFNPSAPASQLKGVACTAVDDCNATGTLSGATLAEQYADHGGAAPPPGVAPDQASGGDAQNGFASPVKLPSSQGLGEPSLIHDSANRLFVAAPQGLGNVNASGGSPLYTSTDLGATWSNPVRAQTCAAASGADSDLVVDAQDDLFAADLYLADSCLQVSTDHGTSFAMGNPIGNEVQPGDDRPWLAYDARSNQVLATYDGVDAIHVANTAPLVNIAAGYQMAQDVPAVPESALSPSYTPAGARSCVCPPGGIAVDNGSGAHAGRVYVSFSSQFGTAIAYTDVTGTCPQCTVSPTWSAPIVIPNSGSSGAPFEDEWNFDPVKVDASGTVYVMWAHATAYDTSSNVATGDVVEQYAYSTDGGATWSAPFTIPTAGTTTFPTMDVVSPGVLDMAWLGTGEHGDPNEVASTTTWDLDYARITHADSAAPAVSMRTAVAGVHGGCIQSGGGKSCPDRTLLDFFQLSDTTDGVPNLIYPAGSSSTGTAVYFTRLVGTPGAALPEARGAGLVGIGVLVPAIALLVRRRRLTATASSPATTAASGRPAAPGASGTDTCGTVRSPGRTSDIASCR